MPTSLAQRKPARAYAYGQTFFTILSPRIQNYTIGIEPNSTVFLLRRRPVSSMITLPSRVVTMTPSAEAAGLTIHVRLMEGDDSQHVLSSIFKALGAALAEACSPARTTP